MNESYLIHYGVKGQRWGIRRYQNEDGSLTLEGRKHLKKEIKRENRLAYTLGQTATTYGRALAYSNKKLAKAQKKADKANASDAYQTKRRTRRLNKDLDIEKEVNANLDAAYKRSSSAAESHAKALVEKYGKENVKDIAYKDVKTTKGNTIRVMNEKVSKGSNYALSALTAVGATVVGAMGGVGYIATPAGKNARGKYQYDIARTNSVVARSAMYKKPRQKTKTEVVHYIRA